MTDVYAAVEAIVRTNDQQTSAVCEVLDVSRSAYHAWLTPERTAQAVRDAELSPLVRDIFWRHRRRYGTRRIVAELAERDESCGTRRVAKLLKTQGLSAIQPKAFVPRTTDSRHRLGYSPNLLLDLPQLTAIHQLGVGDITVVRLSDVQEQEVEWLWPNRIPLGKLTLLAGDPGLGKSFVTVDMSARVSTGTGWPDCYDLPQPVGSVVMFNCEDDIADTVLPRLKRAGGDPRKVIALQGVAIIDAETGQRRQRGFSLDMDLPKLIEVLEANPDVRLVVIDPVLAYCGEKDRHKNAEIRAMLAPLADLASKYRVAVVMVTHLSKGSGGKAVYRAMGSLGFAAAARAVWDVAKDHEDDKRRLILLPKINISEEAAG